MSLRRFSGLQVQNLSTRDKGQKTYSEPSGFGGRVSQGGSRTFIVRLGRARKKVTIGRYPQKSLAEARKEALADLRERPQKDATTALSAALRSYLEERETKNRGDAGAAPAHSQASAR